ncbi:MAG TPA: energy-coupling factor ABC transporter permease [Halobacteria archaeon]|nr:energy-coupling factor ABC transporter permease [Halobacteria archaeon]
MHISDGILTPVWCLIWFIIAIIFLVIGINRIRKMDKENERSYMPILALMGAAVFVISVWHIPVPVTGSSSHPVGTPMASIIIGPFASVVITFIILIIQAFIGHGGLTTLGANTVSMGIVGPFSAYLLFLLFKRLKLPVWTSAGISAFIGSILVYLTTAFQLALSLNPTSVLSHWLIYSAGYIPTQLPLAIAEFIFTAGIVEYIYKNKPDLLYFYHNYHKRD